MTDSPPRVDRQAADPPAAPAPRRRFRIRVGKDNRTAWLSFGLALLATLATGPLIWTPFSWQVAAGQVRAEWQVYLVLAQLVLTPCFLVVGGSPRTRGGQLLFALANLEILALAVLTTLNLLNLASHYLLVLGLRLALLALWTFVLVGLPLVCWRIATRHRRTRTATPRLVKLWFSALVLVLAAEPAAALVSRRLSVSRPIGFPEHLASPAAGELRIACVGESTMAGFPYMKFGIPEVVRWQLEQMYPDRKIVVDDLSEVGLSLRTALQRLDKLTVRPHLLLLYSGHNEFFYDVEEFATDLDTPVERFDWLFKWSPLFRALDRRISRNLQAQELEGGGKRLLVDRPLGSPEARQKRVARFGGELEQLANWGERQDIPQLWYVPAGTEADYAPDRSWLNHSPSDAERSEIESIEREGRSLQDSGRFKEAAEKYRRGLARYEEFADFHFHLAECLTHDGKSGEAAEHYALALELDGLPVRMIKPWRQKVAEVASRHGITVIDCDAILRPHTPSGILDRSVFLDYVHPNMRAYYALGMAAVATIQADSQLQARFGPPKAATHTDFASAIGSTGFTPKDLAMAYRRTAEAERWMRQLHFESSWLAQDAQHYENWRQQLESGKIAPGQGGTEPLK